LVTYPPYPLPLRIIKGRGVKVGEGASPPLQQSLTLKIEGGKQESQREAKPLLKILSPSPWKGEGDEGGEVQVT